MRNPTFVRLGAFAAAAALALLVAAAAARPAQAQFLPAVLYGTGLTPGQKVEAFIGGKSCGSTTASPKGEWVMQVPVDAPCSPIDGAAITFTLDGKPVTANPPAAWQSGGIPAANVRTGYSLGASGTATGIGTASSGTGAESSNDGGGSNPLLFVGIGIVVLAAVAGGGFYLYRRNAVA